MNFYKEKEVASRRFYEARFDDTEQAVLAQLMLVKCGRPLRSTSSNLNLSGFMQLSL